MTHHLTEPWSCRACRHSGLYKPGTALERLYCHKDRFEVSCVFARAEDGKGSCPADPKTGKPLNFEPRSTL